jgi:hypothetical protein
MPIPAAPIVPSLFQEFLMSLETWKASLFHTIELRHPPHKIVRYLTAETFLGVSNGAEKFKCTVFRWMLSRSANGHCHVRCAGPIYGTDPSSLRAEGYGFLSMLQILLQLAEYCDMQLYGCTLTRDNSGLITYIKDSGTVLYPTPSLSLAPDWDIINEI